MGLPLDLTAFRLGEQHQLAGVWWRLFWRIRWHGHDLAGQLESLTLEAQFKLRDWFSFPASHAACTSIRSRSRSQSSRAPRTLP